MLHYVKDLHNLALQLEEQGVSGAVLCMSAAHHIDRITAERDAEREARLNTERALRQKDDAMGVLFDRMRAAGVDFSDFIP